MKRLLLVVFALACVCLLAPAGALAKQHVVDSYCSPSGDYCTAVVRSHGRVKLVLRTFPFAVATSSACDRRAAPANAIPSAWSLCATASMPAASTSPAASTHSLADATP